MSFAQRSRRGRRFGLGLALAALVTLMAPASAGPAAAAPSRELIVFAAASLKDVFTALAAAFEAAHPGVHVVLNLAGSQELRAQIEQGAPIDIFASADRNQIYPLAAAGLVEEPDSLACNRPVVIAGPALAAVQTLGDLPRAQRIVLGAPEVPIGHYTAELLSRAARLYGQDFPARVQARVVSRELNVRQVMAKVVLGEADAAIVYATDALAGRGKVRVVPIPDAVNVVAEYPVALGHGAPHPPLARAFLSLLNGPTGARAFKEAGFLPCPAR
ncbi:MAG TPA: molybdate ABC transporter substrate-binding protein [Polyangia bacterium]|nr:molybdate ABC transporter substrate-binding protein [Polyangia bacterium]